MVSTEASWETVDNEGAWGAGLELAEAAEALVTVQSIQRGEGI